MECFSFCKMMRSMIEKKEWLGFDSFKMEESEMKKRALQCKTLDEIMAFIQY